MRLVFGFVLLLGMGLAGAAVYMAKGFIGQQQAQLAEAQKVRQSIVPTVEVYVLNKPMRYGQRLTLEDIKKVRWPEEAVPEGVFLSEEELFPEGPDTPREVLRTMEADEAVLASKVTEPGENAGISSRLSAGLRAFTIQTDVSSGVGGFLRVGDRVDVYWTGNLPEGRRVTRLIDANIRLIGINQSADEDSTGTIVARTVTVEVSPRQVASLAQAQATGRLSLSLVGVEDATEVESVEIDQNELLGIEEEQVVEVEQEEICTVRRRNGEEIITVQIPCTN